ncbi:MAG: hypothetical protein AAF802_25935 [Planctomycetota bacterium]
MMKFDINSLEFDETETTPTWHNRLTGVLTSMLLHCAMLICLAFMVFSEGSPVSDVFDFRASRADSDDLVDLLSLEVISESLEAPQNAEPLFADLPSEIDTKLESQDWSDDLRPEMKRHQMATLASLAGSISVSSASTPADRNESLFKRMTEMRGGKSYDGPLLKTPKDGVRQSQNAMDAVSGILGQLGEASDHDGPVWILWVMDASISLVEDRQQLAPLVRDFYDKLKVSKKPGAYPWPTTAVFAYGRGVMPLGINKGMPKPSEIASTLINVPIDESGIENVMTAVTSAVGSVPFKNRDTRIEVVVWTDESGDDLYALETAILSCRRRNARVHVVGPLSVFGMRKGLQQFTLPQPFNRPILLPVDRGPDSAFPERAQLPYWYESRDINWANGAAIIPANLGGQNFGGPHRQRLLAPSGPYGLTRLALATGGTFTSINRPGDIASATRDELFDYMPDYRSATEIANDIDQFPLRRAVIEAAALSDTVQYWPPQMDYPTLPSDRFPYRSVGLYLTPQRFAKRLPNDLEESVEGLRGAQMMIEQAIQIMTLRSNGKAGFESESGETAAELAFDEVSLEHVTPSEYYHETSPRWQAWYDLNLGRLLAHSVRIREFVLQCEYLSTRDARAMMTQKGFNVLRMVPSNVLKGDQQSASRRTAAVQLLNRVVKNHPDTPWGDLARWELAHPVGVEPSFSMRPPPRRIVTPVPRMPAQPRPTLPKL